MGDAALAKNSPTIVSFIAQEELHHLLLYTKLPMTGDGFGRIGGDVMVYLCKKRFQVYTYRKLGQRKYSPYKILYERSMITHIVDLPIIFISI